MSESTGNTTVQISMLPVLTDVFITLKLCKVIDWSWYWVFLPLWGPIVLYLLLAIFCLTAVGIAIAIDSMRSR